MTPFDSSDNLEVQTEDVPAEDMLAAERLYEGSLLTVPASNVLLYKFAMKHNLSNECLSDLLQLLKLHCLTPNKCVASTE